MKHQLNYEQNGTHKESDDYQEKIFDIFTAPSAPEIERISEKEIFVLKVICAKSDNSSFIKNIKAMVKSSEDNKTPNSKHVNNGIFGYGDIGGDLNDIIIETVNNLIKDDSDQSICKNLKKLKEALANDFLSACLVVLIIIDVFSGNKELINRIFESVKNGNY